MHKTTPWPFCRWPWDTQSPQ